MDANSGRTEPEGFLVEIVPGERIHFLDWGGPMAEDGATSPVLLVPWPERDRLVVVAGRPSPARRRGLVAIDLRGHGLSDAPTSGYTQDQLAEDVVAVAEGAGLLAEADGRVVLAGHGYGAIVAAWAAGGSARAAPDSSSSTAAGRTSRPRRGMTPDEWLRDLEEPPEVLRSMAAYLADRRDFDPATWDADQEQAARSTVVEVPAGKVVSAVRPHALAGSVEAIFAYDPIATLAAVRAPIVAIVAGGEEADGKRAARRGGRAREAPGRPCPRIRVVDLGNVGHNLMRYRPAEVSAAILAAAR